MEAGKGIVCIENGIGVFAAQIVFNIFAGEGGAAANHRVFELLRLKVLNDILHLQRGLDQQSAEADNICLVFAGGSDDGVRRLLDAEIYDLVAVVAEDDVDQVLADIVDVTLHGGEDVRSLLRTSGLFHLRLKIGDGLLHHSGRVEHRRQLHLARTKEFADGLHAIEQHGIDHVER